MPSSTAGSTGTRTGTSAPLSRRSGAPDSLPRGAEPQHRLRSGAAALVAALVLLVGVPVALVVAVGNPLPTSPPSRDWVTADLTARTLIDVLAVLVWLVWAHFLICFLTEWRAVRAGRMPGRVALGGTSQTLARQLVAGVLLLSGGASVAHGLGALGGGSSSDSPPQPSASAATSAPAPPRVEPTTVIGGRGEQRGVVRASEEASAALTFYEVVIPPGRNYDTLWDISERLLGDPFRYREIFELNRDRVQPDGTRFTDADLIRVGYQLRLPADARGPGVRLLPSPAAPGRQAPDVQAPGGQAPRVEAPGPEAPEGHAERAPANDAAADSALAARARADEAAPVGSPDSGADLSDLLLGGGLLLAGVVRALTARRGPFGDPDPDTAALERAAALRRASFLDAALRTLAESRRAQDQPLPEVLFVYADEDRVVLHLARSASAPERPWTTSEDGASWTLRSEDLTDAGVAERGTRTAAPYPALVNLADCHGYDFLVDLEMAPGLVAVGGDDEVARAVVMSAALDLATHPWADEVTVLLAGFGDELVDLGGRGGSVRHVATLDEAIAEAGREHGRASEITAQLGLHNVLQGRGAALGGNDVAAECSPTVVLASGPPTADQSRELVRLTSGGRTPVAVMCVGDSPAARWRFTVSETGGFDAGVLGVTGTARQLSAAGNRRLTELTAEVDRRRSEGDKLLDTATPAELAGLVAGPVTRPVTSPDGLGAASPVVTRPASHGSSPVTSPAARRGRPEATMPPAHGRGAEPAAVGSSAPAARLRSAPAAVRLLGPVAIERPEVAAQAARARADHADRADGAAHAASGTDDLRTRQLTEVVVMASLHPDGLHEAVISAGLWPRGVEAAELAERLRDTAEWLGDDTGGEPLLARAQDGRWRLSKAVVSDYQVLAAATTGARSGAANDPDLELATLLGALRLGTGRVFTHPPEQYGWLAFAREARRCRLLVTSTARRAVEVAVALGRVDRALEASALGISMVPDAEVLWRERLRLVARHAPERVEDELSQMYAALDRPRGRREPATDALVEEVSSTRGRASG